MDYMSLVENGGFGKLPI